MAPGVRTIGLLLLSCWLAAAPAASATWPGVKPTPATSEAANRVQPAVKAQAVAPAPDGQSPTQPYLRVEWKAGKLTLDAEGIALSEVADAIARQAGLAVEGLDRLQGNVSTSLSGVTLGEAFQKLLVQADYALLEPGCNRGRECQTQLVIFAEASTHSGKPLVAGRGARPRYQIPRQDGSAAPAAASPEVTYFPTEVEKKLVALQSAAAQGDKEALREALEDPDVNVQSAAFENLAALDPQGAVAALLSGTKSDRPELRIQALQLLDHAEPAQDETVLSALADALRDQDASVKRYAIQALASRGEPAMGYLERALNDPDPSIRLILVQSVAQQKGGLELVREAAFSDSDQSVRDTAALIVKQTGSQNP